MLYYFYATSTSPDPGDRASSTPRSRPATIFAKDLQDEFGGRFEYHAYDVSTIEGLSRFLEFGGTALPMFRLVDEQGHSEQFTGTGTFMTLRAHLQRAIEDYSERD